jgi:hypothetical protein
VVWWGASHVSNNAGQLIEALISEMTMVPRSRLLINEFPFGVGISTGMARTYSSGPGVWVAESGIVSRLFHVALGFCGLGFLQTTEETDNSCVMGLAL